MAAICEPTAPSAEFLSDRLTLREKISYGLGDLAPNLGWNAVGAFLLYYYSNVALLPLSALGSLFLLSRLLDACIDPAVGLLVDKTRSRWGRTRPYFIFGAAPFAILTVLTFTVPNFPPLGKLIYAYATFIALGLSYSFVTIPYSALMPMMTRAPDQRLQLGSFRAMGTSLAVILATAATMPLVAALGHGSEARGFPLASLIAALVSFFLLMNLFATCRERHYDNNSAHFAILPTLKDLFRNRAWVVTFLFAMLNFIRFGAVLSITAFFAIAVLKARWAISIMLPSVSGTLLLGAFIAPPFLKRTGLRRGCIGVLVAAICLYGFLPWLEPRPIAFLSVLLAASILISITMTAIFTMAADSVDYHEWKFGVRNEGLLSAGVSLSTKLGMAIGAAGVAYGLAWAGYSPKSLTPLAHDTIRWCYYGWAVGALALQILCIAFWPTLHRAGEAGPRGA